MSDSLPLNGRPPSPMARSLFDNVVSYWAGGWYPLSCGSGWLDIIPCKHLLRPLTKPVQDSEWSSVLMWCFF